MLDRGTDSGAVHAEPALPARAHGSPLRRRPDRAPRAVSKENHMSDNNIRAPPLGRLWVRDPWSDSCGSTRCSWAFWRSPSSYGSSSSSARPRTFMAGDIYISFMTTTPYFALMAIPLTLVVITGEIDLSFGSVMAFGMMGYAVFFKLTGSFWLGFIACLIFGLAGGTAQRHHRREDRRAVPRGHHRHAVPPERRGHDRHQRRGPRHDGDGQFTVSTRPLSARPSA